MSRALAVLSLLLVACGRSPGPLPEEYGKLTYWLLNQSDPTSHECSDAPALDGLRLEPPEFGWVAWYYIYRVNDGGKTATEYDCIDAQAYDPNSCAPEPHIVWRIDGHNVTLDYDGGVVDLGEGCRVRVLGNATLVDGGDKGTVRHEVRFDYLSDAEGCDAAVRERSPNGKGLRECVHGLDEIVYFARAVDPVN